MRLSVGKDAADAGARRQRKEAELNAVNNGVVVVPTANGHRSLAAAVADFLDETKLTKKPKTLAAYSTALAYFVSPATSSILMRSTERIYSSSTHSCGMTRSGAA